MPDQRKPMGSSGGRPGDPRKKSFSRRPRTGYLRKKACFFCVKKIKMIDYKDINLIRRYVTDRGKILPRMVTSTCAKHQRLLTRAIKRARFMGLIAYIER